MIITQEEYDACCAALASADAENIANGYTEMDEMDAMYDKLGIYNL